MKKASVAPSEFKETTSVQDTKIKRRLSSLRIAFYQEGEMTLWQSLTISNLTLLNQSSSTKSLNRSRFKSLRIKALRLSRTFSRNKPQHHLHKEMIRDSWERTLKEIAYKINYLKPWIKKRFYKLCKILYQWAHKWSIKQIWFRQRIYHSLL